MYIYTSVLNTDSIKGHTYGGDKVTRFPYQTLQPILYEKHKNEQWSAEVFSYLRLRYTQIESRLMETSRYVEVETHNKFTFSYEYSSLLRDIGSAFSSVMDKFVDKTAKKRKDGYNINDYTKFLIKEISNIEKIELRLEYQFRDNCYVFPFNSIIKEKFARNKLHWWEPYNKIKHSEIDNLSQGCLEHVIYGIGTLAVLFKLLHPSCVLISKLFGECGFFEVKMDREKDFF